MQAIASSALEEKAQPRSSISKSFSRYEPDHSGSLPEARTSHADSNYPDLKEGHAHSLLSEALSRSQDGDLFESRDNDGDKALLEHADGSQVNLPETFDELPIEIRSLTERFLESLSARVHPTPISIDALSELFQDFYAKADAAIATHIAALSSRLSREASPARRDSSALSELSKGRSRSNSGAKQLGAELGEQQMLTAGEISNRRKARRLLELEKVALEEAVERGVCERLYDRLWRHRSTDDEERDSKLSSKTAALAVVGIGLKELHVDTSVSKDGTRQAVGNQKKEIDESLAPARENVLKMNEERYPLGKLKYLTSAHKSIVETLSQLFPSSSSADEVLPTLIYTLITTPAESINAVSNLHFIQRFRATSKMDGEASYCLVNLEAAISFLETVDLSSLRADETPQGPPKSSNLQSFPLSLDKAPPPQSMMTDGAKLDTSPASTTTRARTDKSPTPSNSSRTSNPQERLNSLIKKADTKIEASRESFLSSADSAFDTINATLNDSFKFVFGRLKEQQQHEREIQKQHATIPDDPSNFEKASNTRSPTVIPETLEDARKIVNPPIPPTDDDAANETRREARTIDREKALFEDPLEVHGTVTTRSSDSKLLDLIGGRPPLRDRSTDSASSTSTETKKRVVFAAPTSTGLALPISPSPPPTTTAMDSVKSLGNSLNPLNRLGGIGFRGFGRQPQATVTPPMAGSPSAEELKGGLVIEAADATHSNANANVNVNFGGDKFAAVVTEMKRLPLPSRRFVEMKDAREMKIGEVEELLREYQRLVAGVQRVVSSV